MSKLKYNELMDKELRSKEKTIRSLQLQLGIKDEKISALECDLKSTIDRAIKSEGDIEEVRENLNSLTAERGKWIRKLKRAGLL